MLGLMLFLLGMSGRKTDEIPVPDRDFTVTITDRDGVVTRARQASMDGDIFFTTFRGEAKLFVPFEKVERVEFGDQADAMVPASFVLRDGERLDVRLRANLRCFGETSYGRLTIRLAAIRSLEFAAGECP